MGDVTHTTPSVLHSDLTDNVFSKKALECSPLSSACSSLHHPSPDVFSVRSERISALLWRRREREVCVNTDSVFVLLLWTRLNLRLTDTKPRLFWDGRKTETAAGKPLAPPQQNQLPNSGFWIRFAVNVQFIKTKTFEYYNNCVAMTLRMFAELPPTLTHTTLWKPCSFSSGFWLIHSITIPWCHRTPLIASKVIIQ